MATEIDHARRLVRASFAGTVSPEDMRGYLLATWATGALEGFDELVDVRKVDPGTLSSGDLLTLSQEVLGAGVVGHPARLAILVKSAEQEEKAAFFGAARGSLRTHAQETRIFYSPEEAEAWLGRER